MLVSVVVDVEVTVLVEVVGIVSVDCTVLVFVWVTVVGIVVVLDTV